MRPSTEIVKQQQRAAAMTLRSTHLRIGAARSSLSGCILGLLFSSTSSMALSCLLSQMRFVSSGTSGNRSSSTAHRERNTPASPPLSIMSWAVDGSGNTHRHCKRRLPLDTRAAYIAATVRTCAPDVVALQDSCNVIAQAICSSSSPIAGTAASSFFICYADTAKRLTAPRSATIPASLLSHDGDSNSNEDSDGNGEVGTEAQKESSTDKFEATTSAEEVEGREVAAPCYCLVGSSRNGRAGELQVFVKTNSRWTARLLPTSPGVTVELQWEPCSSFSSTTTATTSDDGLGSNNNNSGRAFSLPPSVRCVLTNIDLCYRGKSLAVSDRAEMADPDVSLHGSPFTLGEGNHGRTASPSSFSLQSPQEQQRRPEGQLDAHREVALDFVSRVTRPDVLVGNTFLGRTESVRGYEDAFTLAGQPPQHERTTNTFRHHRFDRQTNYFYFVPSSGVVTPHGHKQQLQRRVQAGDGAHKTAEVVVAAADASIGTAVPLDAHVVSKGGDWVVLHQQQEGGEDSTRGVPETAGRYQRCLLRGRGKSSATHGQLAPFLQRYRRVRVVVPRPLVELPIEGEEATWHRLHAGFSTKSAEQAEDDATVTAASMQEEEEESSAVEAQKTIKCSVSDQYPLLTLLN